MISEKTIKALQRSNGVHEIHELWVHMTLQSDELDKDQIETLERLASMRVPEQGNWVIYKDKLIPAFTKRKQYTRTVGKGWVTRAKKTNGRWHNTDK